MKIYLFSIIIFVFFKCSVGSNQAQRLYAHLFEERKVITSIRPIKNHHDTVILFMNLSLLQIMEVNVKNQYLMLNVMIQQEWTDPQFIWDPKLFGNVSQLYVPSDQLWRPDLTLYNNGGSDWDLGGASGTKITVNHDGRMVWKPPMILLSQCTMNVKYFPFDVQNCTLKLGTWTSNGLLIDLRHYAQKKKDLSKLKPVYDNCVSEINYAMDLENYVASGEWDVLEVSAKRNIAKYSCCPEPYIDVTFNIKIKRKTLFFGIIIISPVLIFSFITILVFYLPSNLSKKITFTISIFIACIVFINVIFDASPPTSLGVPLLVRYLLFTLFTVFFAINVSVLVLKVRSNRYPVSPRVRNIFLRLVPKWLMMKYPHEDEIDETCFEKNNLKENDILWMKWQKRKKIPMRTIEEIEIALRNTRTIVDHIRASGHNKKLLDEWNNISVVVDRLFLVLFTFVVTVGTVWIFLQSPSIHEEERILTKELADELLQSQAVQRICPK